MNSIVAFRISVLESPSTSESSIRRILIKAVSVFSNNFDQYLLECSEGFVSEFQTWDSRVRSVKLNLHHDRSECMFSQVNETKRQPGNEFNTLSVIFYYIFFPKH